MPRTPWLDLVTPFTVVAALGILAGLLEPAGVSLAGPVNAVAFIVWSLWLIATAVVALRQGPGRTPSASGRE